MHVPVLLNEVIKILNPRPGEFFIDATLGEGGHALAILEKIQPDGLFLGVDWDKEAIDGFKERIARMTNLQITNPKIILVNDNFMNLAKIRWVVAWSPPT